MLHNRSHIFQNEHNRGVWASKDLCCCIPYVVLPDILTNMSRILCWEWKWHRKDPMYARHQDCHKRQMFIVFLQCVGKCSGKGRQMNKTISLPSCTVKYYGSEAIFRELYAYRDRGIDSHISGDVYTMLLKPHKVRGKNKRVRIAV